MSVLGAPDVVLGGGENLGANLSQRTSIIGKKKNTACPVGVQRKTTLLVLPP